MRKIIATICLQTIKNNARAFAEWTGKPVCAVVKADAYGHGAIEVVNALQGVADSFAVSLLDEALAIRTVACGKEILILTPPAFQTDVEQAILNGFSITVDTLKTARLAVLVATALAQPLTVHLKVNTGMNRYGMNAQTLGKTCGCLRRCPWIRVRGLYSHFYGTALRELETQYRAFLNLKKVCKRYYPEVRSHISATSGALFGGRFAEDFVRIGIGLYGYLPQGLFGIPQSVATALHLQPAMRVYAQISAKRTYQTGGVGYGKPKKLPKTGECLYVVRYGYADGFLRNNKNGLNNLCMDACVCAGRARVGRYTCIMENAEVTARNYGTISYEVLCAVNRRTERIYTYDETAFCKKGRRGYKRP